MNVVICQYTAKPGREADLEALLVEHAQVLEREGLKTDTPTQRYRGLGTDPKSHGAHGKYVEIFSWASDESMKKAHESAAVMRIWEGIGEACSFMDFPSYAAF